MDFCGLILLLELTRVPYSSNWKKPPTSSNTDWLVREEKHFIALLKPEALLQH
jgi:hypothetical protein